MALITPIQETGGRKTPGELDSQASTAHTAIYGCAILVLKKRSKVGHTYLWTAAVVLCTDGLFALALGWIRH